MSEIPVVKVMEPEKHREVEDMEKVDNIREERLDRVRMRKLEWQANRLCKEKMKRSCSIPYVYLPAKIQNI